MEDLAGCKIASRGEIGMETRREQLWRDMTQNAFGKSSPELWAASLPHCNHGDGYYVFHGKTQVLL